MAAVGNHTMYRLLALATILLGSLVYAAESTCTKTPCPSGDCKTTECVHGDCSTEGICQCQKCWTGADCNTYENNNRPLFPEDAYEVRMLDEPTDGEHIFTAVAFDADDVDWTANSPCEKIVYGLNGDKNIESLFWISPNNGSIYIKNANDLTQETYTMNVTATNEQVSGQSTENAASIALLTVVVLEKNPEGLAQPFQEDDNVVHHRSKRGAPTPPSQAIPDKATFTIYKLGKYDNVTSMRVGEKVKTRLMIHFPAGTTDMYVELFTPLNETTIMKLCNPIISHVGSNLDDFNHTHAEPKLESQDGSINYDRALIDLGNITNNEADTTDYTASMIYIDFDAIMLDNREVANSSRHWVSAGAAFNDQTFIWVGQAAYEAILGDMDPPRSPEFEFTGPSQMYPDSSAIFTVDMFISHPSTNVRIDAFAPLNTTSVMTVCGISIKDTADHYSCLPPDYYKATMTESETGVGNWHGSLDLGTIVNGGSREADAVKQDDRITVAIMAHLMSDVPVSNGVHNLGVAVEVGDIIWAAEAPITVVDPIALPEMTEIPTLTPIPVTGLNAYINRPAVIELEMVVPRDTSSSYELEVVVPTNTSIDFKICSISLVSSGTNVACVHDGPAEYFTDENATTTNRARLRLGRITNTPIRNTTDTHVDTVRFEIVVQALNSSEFGPGDKFWVTMGMNFSDTKIWVGQQAFYVQETLDNEERTNPTFKMDYSFGDENVPTGDSREILYRMWTTPGAVYTPAYIEVIMPENMSDSVNSTLFTICEVKVVSVGKNVPCLNATEASSQVVYQEQNGLRDKAILSLNYICNTGRHSSTDEDMVVLSVIVKVQEYVENGTMDWVGVGIMLTNETMWVGQVAMLAIRDTPMIINPNSKTPYVGMELASNVTQPVVKGYFVLYSVYVKIPSHTSMTYELNVTSLSQAVSICGMKIANYGEHIPCMNKSMKATYSDFPGTNKQQTGSMNLGPIASFGPENWAVNESYEFAADTLQIDVYVKLTTDESLALGTHTIKAELSTSDGHLLSATDSFDGTNVQADISSNDTVEEPPVVTFFMVDVYDTEAENTTFEIGRGEAKRFITDVIIQEPFLAEVDIRFFTPLNNTNGDIEICGAQLLSVGANLPCLERSEIEARYENRSDLGVVDVAILNLGFVCFFPTESSTTDTNKIRLEAVMKVKKDTDLTSAVVSSSVRVGDTYIILTDLTVTITENASMPEFRYLNETNSTIPHLDFNLTSENMTIGEVMTIPVLVTIPANTSSDTQVDIKLPVNESAHMTVQDMRVISAGKNIACLKTFDHVVVDYISQQNTSQNDFGRFDFGIVTNSGFSHRSDQFDEADDQILVEFDVQMADSMVNEADSFHEVSVAVKYGGVIVLLSHYILVIRSNDEKPELEIIADFNFTDPLSTSDKLLVNAVLKHLNTSTAEGINVSASFYLPPYVTFLSLNYSNLEATADMADGSVLRIEFPQLYFTDVVIFGILLQVLTNSSSPFSLIDAITPYEAGATMYYRPDSNFTTGEFFTTELKDISYKVTAVADTGCNIALGMEDGGILDCQISGSVSPDTGSQPRHGRLNGASGWSPYQRGGKFDRHRYMEVYFGNKTKVSVIHLRHMPSLGDARPTQLQVFYSDDGIAWLPGDKIIPSPALFTDVDLPVLTPRESRYIRLYVLSSQVTGNEKVALQVEFKGCAVSADVQVSDACPVVVTPKAEYTERSFLYGGTHVYACDADPDNDLALRCVSSDDGDNWRILDKSVANVIGYHAPSQEIFALASDTLTYMSSLDNGQTWSCILPDTWVKMSGMAGFLDHTPVPWKKDAALDQAGDPVAPYVFANTWGAKADGIYFNTGGGWVKRMDWMNCCP